MAGVKIVQAPRSNNTQELILTNSASLDYGDFVTIDSNGFLNRTAATEKVMGYYLEQRKTVASDNQTVAAVKGRYQPLQGTEVFELTADQACTQTDVGAYADIKLVSTTFQADLNSGATGQFLVVDFDPARDGSTTVVRLMVAEPQKLAFAQS